MICLYLFIITKPAVGAILDDITVGDDKYYGADDYYDGATQDGWPVCAKPIYNAKSGVLDISAVIYACSVGMPAPSLNPAFLSE